MSIHLYMQNPGYYRVKVIPQQAKAEFRGVMDDGTMKIALTSAPEKGKANKELIKFLSQELETHEISISSGLTSRLKVIRLGE